MDVKARIMGLAVKGATLAPTGMGHALLILALVLFNQLFNVAATIDFAQSGLAASARGFIFWQFVGSIFGLGTQITFAGMVRFFSLRFANAIGIGLAFLSAQVFAAYYYMHEPFSTAQWFGTTLVFLGILFIALGR
jgi:hypothetical protein